MANAHYHVKVVRRSQGHSVVAGAAYRLATKLLSQRTGRTISFAGKPGVLHQEIVAPTETPAWLIANAEALWNEVDRCERRVDAQLAREVEFSLPRELTRAQNLALAREIVNEHWVRHGMIAHFAIHDEEPGGRPTPHVHCLVTMRRVGPEGFSRLKAREWDADDLFMEQRAGWAASTNRALALAGQEARIDHRSYKDRGIDLEPQPKLGRMPKDAGSDKRDVVQRRQQAYQRVRQRNADQLFARPEIALDFLTSPRSTFTRQELEAFVVSRLEDLEAREDLLVLVFRSPELVRLPRDARGRERFSSRKEMARQEALLRAATMLARRERHTVADELVDQALALAPHKLSAEQKQGVRYLARPGAIAILEGHSGSGKSTVAGVAKLAWEAQGYYVAGGALSAVAVNELSVDAKIQTRSLDAWCRAWDRGLDRLTPRHVFVLDDAATLDTRSCAALIQRVRAAGAKLVLVGDTRQVPGLDPEAPIRKLAERTGSERLGSIVRQQQTWQRALTLQLAGDQTAEALSTYHARERVHEAASKHAALTAMVERWACDRQDVCPGTALLLAHDGEDVRTLNNLARAHCQRTGELGRGHPVLTTRGTQEFAVGDRISFEQTDASLGVQRGAIGTLEWLKDARWVVQLDDGRRLEVDTRRYRALEHGYARSLHDGRGDTVGNAYVYASRAFDADAVYATMSRHRTDAHMFYSAEEFANARALIESISQRREEAAPAPELACAERLTARFADDVAFADLSADERTQALSILERASMQPIPSAKDVFTQLEKARAAERELREARLELLAANRELQQYTARHPALGRFHAHTSELERAAAVASAKVEHAERLLVTIQADPTLQREADELARNRTLRIEAVRVTWADLRRYDRQLSRAQRIGLWVRTENARTGHLALRAPTSVDEGRQFDVVREEKREGAHLLVLRDPRGGPLMVADAEHCRQERTRTAALFRWRLSTRVSSDDSSPRTRSRGSHQR